jgi:hypothetical protein
MIKKAFKYFFLGLMAIILLLVIAYYSLLGWEYITGSKYVEYLEANIETIASDETFTYKLVDGDIEKNQLILVGESHGFEEPTKFDFHFFKHLYSKFGVRTYVAELDFVQANLMNQYLESGNDSLLNAILKNWVVSQGRNNKDYYDKYRAFHQFFKQLPEGEKFRFVGVDKYQDYRLLTFYINQLSKLDSTLKPIIFDPETTIGKLQERLKTLMSIHSMDSAMRFDLQHLLKNLNYKVDKLDREEVMFQNFYDLYKYYNLSETKVYGYFGLYHVMQYRINGNHPFASKVRKSDLGLDNKMMSMNFLFVDSDMVTASKMLPEFMRDEGKYTKMNISTDNILIMYIYGIGDLKRTTKANHKSIIKMNGEDNPYANSNRLRTTFQVLPLTDIFEMTDEGQPYVQYTIFVRNSDWAEPNTD